MGYYQRWLASKPETLVERIAFKIFDDIDDRGGLSDELDSIKEETKEEILSQWVEIIKSELSK